MNQIGIKVIQFTLSLDKKMLNIIKYESNIFLKKALLIVFLHWLYIPIFLIF